MELAFITLRFDSPEEQKIVEENVTYFKIWEHEIWKQGSGYRSWTEFDISGCTPEDVLEELKSIEKILHSGE